MGRFQQPEKGGGVAYDPKPIDTADVVLSPEILKLTERLAESTHDTWARKRLEDGW
jgi:hypothetical protein